MSEHLSIVEYLVILEGVAPGLLVPGHHVDILHEGEYLLCMLVPSRLCGEHVVIPPGVGIRAENGYLGACVVVKRIGLDEHRIGVHVDIAQEAELPDLGIVGTLVALDDLAILVPHRRTELEGGETVLCVVVQVMGPEGVLVLVLQLHQGTAELGKVVIDEIVQFVAAQYGPVLDDLDMAVAADYILVDVPDGRVAQELGRIVFEAGIAQRLAVADPIFLLLLELVAAEKPYEAVFPLIPLGGQAAGDEQEQDGICQAPGEHRYLVNLESQPARLNSQSLNIGSMMMWVSLILPSRNSSIAFICLSILTCL